MSSPEKTWIAFSQKVFRQEHRQHENEILGVLLQKLAAD